MTMRKLLALSLAAVMALSLAACGSDSSDDQSSQSRDDESELSASQGDGGSSSDGDSSSDDGSSSDGDSSSDVPDLGNMGDCVEAAAAFAQVTLIPLGLTFGATEEDLAELQDSLDELDASIPDEVKDDYEVLRDAYAEFGEVMSGVDFTDPGAMLDPDTADAMEEAGALLETPEVQEATDNIDAYFSENCG